MSDGVVGVVGELVQDGGVNSGEVAEPLLDPRGGINAGGNASFWRTKRRIGACELEAGPIAEGYVELGGSVAGSLI